VDGDTIILVDLKQQELVFYLLAQQHSLGL